MKAKSLYKNQQAIFIIMVVVFLAVLIVAARYIFINYVHPASSFMTSSEETSLQQQIAKIISDKNPAGCATLGNENYRLACNQFFSSSTAVLTQPTADVNGKIFTIDDLTKQSKPMDPKAAIPSATSIGVINDVTSQK